MKFKGIYGDVWNCKNLQEGCILQMVSQESELNFMAFRVGTAKKSTGWADFCIRTHPGDHFCNLPTNTETHVVSDPLTF